jgi:hypothetical protein
MTPVALLTAEKILNDPKAGGSLIGIFYELSLAFPGGEPPPKNAVIPRDWVLYSAWKLDESDTSGISYTLRTEVYWPDGQLFVSSGLPADPANIKDYAIFHLAIQGLPIGQEGDLRIVTWLEQDEKVVSQEKVATVSLSHNLSGRG